jgi:2-polyprenyl-3-methyl-5-hydroxy-6-metoxy-1,4-benzoquinol methylase
MQRDLKKINLEYELSEVDPWGSDWRGSLALWHDYCIDKVLSSMDAASFAGRDITIADIGCGSGILTEKLYTSISNKFTIAQYNALDVSSAAIEKAKRIFSKTKVHYLTVSEDLHEISQNKYDVIFGFQFLSYLTQNERNKLFSTVKNILSENGIAFFSSNVRSDGEDHAYLNSFELEKDISNVFTIIDKTDLFTAQYVENFEAKIFKYAKLSPIRSLLSSRVLPMKFHSYYSNRSTEQIPTKRMRMYILK